MVHWKNKPINELNKQELQEALLQSLKISFDDQTVAAGNDMFKTFIFGFGAGAFLVLAGLIIGSLL